MRVLEVPGEKLKLTRAWITGLSGKDFKELAKKKKKKKIPTCYKVKLKYCKTDFPT